MFKSPLVVGYRGEIGSFILNGLLKTMPKALNIWCFDINENELEQAERISKADYIFLCVPIQETVNWLIKWKSFLQDKIIVEQCSLKSIIYEDNRIKDLDYRSMHLLFRPSATPNKEDRVCILLPIESSQYNSEFVTSIQNITNSKIWYVKNYQEHDKLMAKKQALIHKVLLALDDDNIDTYTSLQIKKLINRIKLGNKELYDFIQTNKYLPEVLKEFNQKINGL
jgi:prephenate dehydrogenase